MILGAHENGSQAPTAVEVSRVQEKDLPRRVRLHFANFLHDHEASEQSASRITTEAIDELDVELPISMEPDTAAQLAEIMLYAQWVGRNHATASRSTTTGSRSSPPTASRSRSTARRERVRIVAVDYKIGGILRDRRRRATTTAPTSRPPSPIPSAALGRRAGRPAARRSSVRRAWCCSTSRACSDARHRRRLLRRDLRRPAAMRAGPAQSSTAATTAA